MQLFQPNPASGSPPYIIAHRGISAKSPENTLASFALATKTPGIDMIELDVRLSRDDEVIVLHDRTLQRTSTGNGAARNYAYDEIRAFDAGSWFHPSFGAERIPTLRSVLELVRGKRWVNIELKSGFLHREPSGLIESKVLKIVNDCGMDGQVMFSSFDHGLIMNLKKMSPKSHTGVLYNLYRDFVRLPSRLAIAAGAAVFVCAKQELRKKMIRDAHAHGIAVYVYTLNSLEDVRKMLELGVDGILSDNADDIVTIVKGNPSIR
ncbi:MAG TPA: glycerophosphodiester phosphodiesterase family protein [Bacteroidota bacterium]|nr:glycerophosphodiester phosphodiesterase family protein [Bacteroidota bacterium]